MLQRVGRTAVASSMTRVPRRSSCWKKAKNLRLMSNNTNVKLTKDPEGRAVMGNISGGSAALIMAWFRNDLYNRVLTTSGTFVNQAWPFDPKFPDRAWGFHESCQDQVRINKHLRSVWHAKGSWTGLL